MPSLYRKILIVSLVALHATVMVGGTCLHALPGGGHRPVAAGTGDDLGISGLSKAAHASTNHCAICDLLSLGQVLIDLDRGPSVTRVCGLSPVESVERPFCPSPLSASPRAPPVPSQDLA